MGPRVVQGCEGAQDNELKEMIEFHPEETREHVHRLELLAEKQTDERLTTLAEDSIKVEEKEEPAAKGGSIPED
jgi:ferritin-like metal-binding protein YciE